MGQVVYATTTLCVPQRGTDMLSYLYIMALAHHEFHFAACLAYDIAFRKKAVNFQLSSWGRMLSALSVCLHPIEHLNALYTQMGQPNTRAPSLMRKH